MGLELGKSEEEESSDWETDVVEEMPFSADRDQCWAFTKVKGTC